MVGTPIVLMYALFSALCVSAAQHSSSNNNNAITKPFIEIGKGEQQKNERILNKIGLIVEKSFPLDNHDEMEKLMHDWLPECLNELCKIDNIDLLANDGKPLDDLVAKQLQSFLGQKLAPIVQPFTQFSSKKELRPYQGSVNAIDWSPDNSVIATAGEDKKISLWNAQTAKIEKSIAGHTGFITSVVWLDNSSLLSSSYDGTVKKWDTNTLQSEDILSSAKPIRKLTISPDRKKCIVSGNALFTVIDTQSKKKVYELPVNPEEGLFVACSDFSCVTWDPSSKKIAFRNPSPEQLSIVDLETKQIVQTLVEKKDNISKVSLAWSPDGKFIAAGSFTETNLNGKTFVTVFNAKTGVLYKKIMNQALFSPLTALSWHPNGQLLAIGSMAKDVTICDIDSGEIVETVRNKHNGRLLELKWDKFGNQLATVATSGPARIFSGPADLDKRSLKDLLLISAAYTTAKEKGYKHPDQKLQKAIEDTQKIVRK